MWGDVDASVEICIFVPECNSTTDKCISACCYCLPGCAQSCVLLSDVMLSEVL